MCIRHLVSDRRTTQPPHREIDYQSKTLQESYANCRTCGSAHKCSSFPVLNVVVSMAALRETQVARLSSHIGVVFCSELLATTN
jgi:hypothetical protein